jgi:hypothetical protein
MMQCTREARRTCWLRRLALVLVTTFAVLAASGCQGVKPWERDLLARPDMQTEDDAHLAALRSHTWFSKEASLVGGGGAGGGCGCN